MDNENPKAVYVWIEVSGMIRETDKAFLYATKIGEVWIPRSQLGARKKGPDGQHIKIELPRWIAVDKGLYDPRAK